MLCLGQLKEALLPNHTVAFFLPLSLSCPSVLPGHRIIPEEGLVALVVVRARDYSPSARAPMCSGYRLLCL